MRVDDAFIAALRLPRADFSYYADFRFMLQRYFAAAARRPPLELPARRHCILNAAELRQDAASRRPSSSCKIPASCLRLHFAEMPTFDDYAF